MLQFKIFSGFLVKAQARVY